MAFSAKCSSRKIVAVTLSVVAVALLQGCKLQVVPNIGGDVGSKSGQHYCRWYSSFTAEECTIEVSDALFEETFVATPAPGYKFVGWAKGPYHLCGRQKGPCELSTKGFEKNEGLLSILKSRETFYLRPLFARRHDDKSNPLAKYNGVWEFTMQAGPLDCTDGVARNRAKEVERLRLSVEPDGYIEMIYNQYTPDTEVFDGWYDGWGSRLTFDDWRNGGELDMGDRVYVEGGYRLRMYMATFAQGNSTVMTGTFSVGNQYPEYHCRGEFPMTARRISN